ncbi:MAG: site-specific integrase [Bryobacteraceae bacterium]
MALNLYRRHLRVARKCVGGHEPDSRSYEPDELRRGWKKCHCPIYLCGTLGGRFRRRNSEQTKWEDAKVVAAALEVVNSWDGKPIVVPAVAAPEESQPRRVTIVDACAVFLSLREGEKIAPATLRKYRTFTKQLRVCADAEGYLMLDQFTVADVDALYSGLKLGVRTKAKWLGTLRAFFRFCVNREWLPKSPVSGDLKAPRGSTRVANKIPFTDEELARIINACDFLGEVTWSNWQRKGVWTGEDAKDFIWTLTFTGLRISDVALFDINRLQGNEVFLRAKKNGGDVFVFVPDWLRDRLRQRSKKWGPMLFVVGDSARLETVTDTWRRKLNKVFDLSGRFDERPTPHRFRHTFARILLQRGVPVADVADLLGDNEKTVREHYARWVPERQARLTRILQEAFDDKPRPKLVALPGGRS